MAGIADTFMAGIHEVRKSWGWFVVLGVLLMILGVLCIGKAQTATHFSILVLGWVLAISAVFWLVVSFQAAGWSIFFMYLLNAILRGVVAYLLIRHPDAGAAGVTGLLAVLFIVGGLFRMVGAGVIQFPYWGWTVVSGVVAVGLGVFLLATWPAATAYFVGIAVGVDLIFDGGALVAFGAAIRSLP
ncbi:MAG TPA: DUF308 domain-containing protein [Terriglobia bacterium]|nr:DUF308 domain-containing protein [Terriglobia bacterium]